MHIIIHCLIQLIHDLACQLEKYPRCNDARTPSKGNNSETIEGHVK